MTDTTIEYGTLDPLEVIERFLDGEWVDPEALKGALALDTGRQHLVDVVTLRELAGGETRLPPLVLHDRRRVPRWIAAVAAAAALCLSVTGGYVAGHRGTAPRVSDLSAVIEAPRVASAPSERVIAPPATIVVRVDPGPAVEWNAPVEGN